MMIKIRAGLDAARQHAARGNIDAAVKKLEELLGLGEAAQHILWPLAELYQRKGQQEKALERYRNYLRDFPDKPVVHYNLAFLLRQAGAHEDAVSHYKRALTLGIDQPEEVWLNIGVIYSDFLRREDLARQALEKALSLHQDYIPALFNLANLNEQEGRLAEAREMFAGILEIDPGYFDALARLGELGKFSDPEDAIIGKMREAAKQGRMELSTRINLFYALGSALDQCGEYEEAFASYRMANDLDRKTLPAYNPWKMEKYVDELIRVFSRDWFSSLSQETAACPIFICGMFRSGSTLLEQILASHSRVTAGGEIDFYLKKMHQDLKPFPHSMAAVPTRKLTELGGEYLQLLEENFPGYDRITDKRPDNILAVGLIKSLFPKARIIFTRRNPLDNCLSVYFMRLGPMMNYATDLANIAHYYKQCDRLWQHWQQLFPETTHEVVYDDLVETPEPVIRGTVEFCGLDWDENCLNFHQLDNVVKTGSVLQVRQPLYRSSSGRWRNYEPWIGPLKNLFQT